MTASDFDSRVYQRADGGLSVEVFYKDDERSIAHLTVHEQPGSKLWRKFAVGIQAREDGRVRRSSWDMRVSHLTARVLRGDSS